MEERLMQYLLGHPAAALVFLAGAFWARHEIMHRNGNNVPKLLREIRDSHADLAQQTKLHREAVAERHLRILETQLRIEQKIDAGVICPMRRAGQ